MQASSSTHSHAFGIDAHAGFESHRFIVTDMISALPLATSLKPATVVGHAGEELPHAEPGLEPEPVPASREDRASAPSVEADEALSLWKEEVAARVNRYRMRRPRTPRYPSLALKFDPPKPETDDHGSVEVSASVNRRGGVEFTPIVLEAALVDELATPVPAAEPTARILEFPRPAYMPSVVRPDAIADPVMDLPRILDVPEVMPPPPALGGIHIEAEISLNERRPGFEIPLQPASFAQRVGAAALDALLVGLSLIAFGAIFFGVSHAVLNPRELAGAGVGVGSALWLLYQHLLLACSGSTVGLRCAKLELRKFDGSRVSRSTRFLRTLAAMLSAASLGIGYLWCFLDEDQLCWHDRITRSYMAPQDLASN